MLRGIHAFEPFQRGAEENVRKAGAPSGAAPKGSA
jgi:hypothetical protein